MTDNGYAELLKDGIVPMYLNSINCAESKTLYTGEFYFSDSSRPPNNNGNNPQKPRLIYRKSRDTYVFLKDYKPKMTEMITRLGRLESHFNYYRKIFKKERVKRGKEKEKLLNERIEKLEEQVYNLLNPPIKPELQNPFD